MNSFQMGKKILFLGENRVVDDGKKRAKRMFPTKHGQDIPNRAHVSVEQPSL